ncbi:hypothetical protein ACXYMU_07315 [Pontibacter sp. CAU 1760]
MHKKPTLYLLAGMLTVVFGSCQQQTDEEGSIASTHPKLEEQLANRGIETPISDNTNPEIYNRYRVTMAQYQQNNQFRVSAVYSGQLASLKPSSDSHAGRYKSEIVKAMEQGINFAGKYTIATVSCGENCQEHFVINRISGKIVESIKGNTGTVYNPDSRLLILNPPDSTIDYDACKACHPQVYEFVDDTFRKLPHDAF